MKGLKDVPYIEHGALCLGTGSIEYGVYALLQRAASDLYPGKDERALEKTSI